MNTKKGYQYFYYRLYKYFESGVVWMTEWKASASLDILEVLLLASFGCYYKVITKNTTDLSLRIPIVWVPVLAIILFNYFTFHSRDQWKQIVKQFNQLDKRTNIIGKWIFWGVIIFVIANFAFSYYLLLRIDWSKYR